MLSIPRAPTQSSRGAKLANETCPTKPSYSDFQISSVNQRWYRATSIGESDATPGPRLLPFCLNLRFLANSPVRQFAFVLARLALTTVTRRFAKHLGADAAFWVEDQTPQENIVS
jgi:hypothetical protein